MVEPVNDLPVAEVQTGLTTNEETPVSITLTGSDADENVLSYEVLSGPASGVLSGTAPDLIYTPNSKFDGTDSFTFKVNDGVADSAPATVSIIVYDMTVAQSISLVEGWNLVSLHVESEDMTPSGIFGGHFDVIEEIRTLKGVFNSCLLYTSPSPRD